MTELPRLPADRLRVFARLARYGTVLLIFSLFVCTHVPGQAIPQQVAGLDKFAHCFIYMAIAFSVLTSWELSVGLLRPQHYFTVWLLGTLYGAFDEITQIPVGRHCDGFDWLCDIVGLVLGLTCYRLLRPVIFWLVAGKATAH